MYISYQITSLSKKVRLSRGLSVRRQTDRQTDRETDRQTDRQTDRLSNYIRIIYIDNGSE